MKTQNGINCPECETFIGCENGDFAQCRTCLETYEIPDDQFPVGEQISSDVFCVENTYFQGDLTEAHESFKRAKPSQKWFVWLQDLYLEIEYKLFHKIKTKNPIPINENGVFNGLTIFRCNLCNDLCGWICDAKNPDLWQETDGICFECEDKFEPVQPTGN